MDNKIIIKWLKKEKFIYMGENCVIHFIPSAKINWIWNYRVKCKILMNIFIINGKVD